MSSADTTRSGTSNWSSTRRGCCLHTKKESTLNTALAPRIPSPTSSAGLAFGCGCRMPNAYIPPRMHAMATRALTER